VPRFLDSSPLYEYELLSDLFDCKISMKLENLQVSGHSPLVTFNIAHASGLFVVLQWLFRNCAFPRFFNFSAQKTSGDRSRGLMSILVSHYLNQKEAIGKDIMEVSGPVMCASRSLCLLSFLCSL
jgi:hypothetical protein